MLHRIKGYFAKSFPMKKKVVTRFAPSPTGLFHAGSYRTAVFSYLYAKQNKGKFILRIEDTDIERSKKEYEDNILQSLEWLSLSHDEIYKQSDRGEIYKEYLEKLLKEDKIYISKEEPKEPGDRTSIIRFRNPNKKVKFTDIIRGDIEFDTTELGDFVIAKSITEPIFHFAVVLDDFLMGITHVIRGEDHVSNTPRQILIQEALGAPTPLYAHLPLVLAHDRSKLSKRHGAKSMIQYKDAGYLPNALLNYMSLLGWNPGTEQEIFDLDGLVKAFDLSKVQKGGAIFNEDKLRWINKEHLKLMPFADLVKNIQTVIIESPRAKDLGWKIEKEMISKIAPVLLDRIETFGDIKTSIESQDLDFYFSEPHYDALSLKWKGETDLYGAQNHLSFIKSELEKISERNWSEENIKSVVWPYAENQGRGAVLWPLRFCLSGKEKSPNPFTLASILGKKTTLKRIQEALKLCSETLANANNS